MTKAWVFLHELARFAKYGSRKGLVPTVRLLAQAVEIADDVARREVQAGRISQPDYYSEEIRRYEQSALGSSRVI